MGGSGLARHARALQQRGDEAGEAAPAAKGMPLARCGRALSADNGSVAFERTDVSGSGNSRYFHAMSRKRDSKRTRARATNESGQHSSDFLMPTAAAVGITSIIGLGTGTAAAAPMPLIPLGMAATAMAFAAI